MTAAPFLVAGLGNPGEKYEGTRHNIGFEVVDAFADACNSSCSTDKWQAQVGRVSLGAATVHLLKPMAYMNRSGIAVARVCDFFKIPLSHLLVVHDDIDMRTGRLKLVKGGGTGGHKGIRSIVDCLGEKDFYRLKIGVGRPGKEGIPADIPIERYVLTRFGAEERDHLAQRLPEVLVGLRTFLAGDAAGAMAFLNGFK